MFLDRIFDTDIVLKYSQHVPGNSNTQNAAIKHAGRLWPGAIIPYTFARSIGKCDQKYGIILDRGFMK